MKRPATIPSSASEHELLIRQLTASLEQVARSGRGTSPRTAPKPVVTFLDSRMSPAEEDAMALPDNIIQFPIPGQ
jgi:hypothetical protein